MTVGRIICILIGYAIGLFQTGYIYGKTQHIDIREHGSGNAGTTNTLRTLGFKAGAITFAGDCGKAILAIFISWLIFHEQYPEGIKLLGMYAGLGAVLGHNYPFYMKFKGGKGIACTTGVILAFHWQMAPLCIGLFIVVVLLTQYVSLGSILLVSVFFIELIVWPDRASSGRRYISAGNLCLRWDFYTDGDLETPGEHQTVVEWNRE